MSIGDPFQNRPLQGRLIDEPTAFTPTLPVYTGDCPVSPCGAFPVKFRSLARMVDLVQLVPPVPPLPPGPPPPPTVAPGGNVPVYVIQPPGCCTGKNDIISTPCSGSATRDMLMRYTPVSGLADCGQPFCQLIKLSYVGTDGFGDHYWEGILQLEHGTATFRLTCVAAGPQWVLAVQSSTCGFTLLPSLGGPINLSPSCNNPITFTASDLIATYGTCCSPTPLCTTTASISIVGACGLVKAARLVGVEEQNVGGVNVNMPVYAWTECCPQGVTSVAPNCCNRWGTLIGTVISGTPACLIGATVVMTPPSCGSNHTGTFTGHSCTGTITGTTQCYNQDSSPPNPTQCEALGPRYCQPDGYGDCDQRTFQAGVLDFLLTCGPGPGAVTVDILGQHPYVCNICDCGGAEGENPIDYTLTFNWQRVDMAACPDFGTFLGDTGTITVRITQ